jgi:hypothetical protein
MYKQNDKEMEKLIKTIIIACLFLTETCSLAANEYEYEPFSNTLPSEQSLEELEALTARPQMQLRDGPPGGGSGGGGAVGTPVGDFSGYQWIVILGFYCLLKKRAIPDCVLKVSNCFRKRETLSLI